MPVAVILGIDPWQSGVCLAGLFFEEIAERFIRKPHQYASNDTAALPSWLVTVTVPGG